MTRRVVEVREWDPEALGVLSEDTIRALHAPANRYRISRKSFPRGASFPGAMRKGTCFVLEGVCRYRTPEPVDLHAGQYAEIAEGEYEFEVLGDQDVVLVMVWELPFAVPSIQEQVGSKDPALQ